MSRKTATTITRIPWEGGRVIDVYVDGASLVVDADGFDMPFDAEEATLLRDALTLHIANLAEAA